MAIFEKIEKFFLTGVNSTGPPKRLKNPERIKGKVIRYFPQTHFRQTGIKSLSEKNLSVVRRKMELFITDLSMRS